MHRIPYSRTPLRLRISSLYLAGLLLLLTLQPLAAQNATEEPTEETTEVTEAIGNLPMLRADVPENFVAEYAPGRMSLVRPDDMLTIYIAAGDYAAAWYAEPPPLDPKAAIDAYNPFDMYTFDTTLRTTETVGDREIFIQPFYDPVYGENTLLLTTLLDPETLLVATALKADADPDEADRALLLDFIGSLEVDPEAEPIMPEEPILPETLPEGEIRLMDGTTFNYSDDYAPLAETPFTQVVTLWANDNLTYITMYVNDNDQRIAEHNAAEFNVEPSMQQSGLDDFQADSDGEIISDENGRTVTRYISQEWSPYGQSQVNFYYLVVEGEEHMALTQGLTYDVANLEAHLEAAEAMAESLVFGESE